MYAVSQRFTNVSPVGNFTLDKKTQKLIWHKNSPIYDILEKTMMNQNHQIQLDMLAHLVDNTTLCSIYCLSKNYVSECMVFS